MKVSLWTRAVVIAFDGEYNTCNEMERIFLEKLSELVKLAN